MMNTPSGAPCIDALPPDSAKTSRSTWLAVGSLSVGSFAMVSTEFMPIGLLTDIASTLNVSNGTAGLMITMPGILAAFAGPGLIVASGRLDRRTLLIGLTVALIASNPVSYTHLTLPTKA